MILIDCDSDDEDEDGKDGGNHHKNVFLKQLKVFAPQIGCQCYVQPRQHPQSSSGRRKPFLRKC